MISHAISIRAEETPEQAMARLSQYTKERLIEDHQREVAALLQDIEGWRQHDADQGNAIRAHRKRTDKLYLLLFGVGCLAAYAMMMSSGCAAGAESNHVRIGALR